MNENIRQIDIKYLWHPCTPINEFENTDFPVIERAKGVYLYETGGRPILDGIASWWCVNLGHSHPKLVAAIQKQASLLQHSILGGMSHPNVIKLAERLAHLTPGDLSHAFFCCDGASAVEAALKIATQYWANNGEVRRKHFIALTDGYHGDTLGAMGAGYVDAFHKDYKDIVKPAMRASSPHCTQCPCGQEPETCNIECFDSMTAIVEEHHKETIAIIVEPLCQGAAGVRIYPEEYLVKLRKLCDDYGLLLIADEIAVGFGRTGHMFACERAGIVPDIMTIGKGMTGGYMPMSAVMASDKIYNSFRNKGTRDNTFWHSHTFGGNPITSALALAALDVYEDENVLEKARPQMDLLKHGFAEIGALLGNSKIRTLGMMGVVEVNDACGGAQRAAGITQRCMELGLFLRPRDRAVYLWPPLNITKAEMNQMLSILKDAIRLTD